MCWILIFSAVPVWCTGWCDGALDLSLLRGAMGLDSRLVHWLGLLCGAVVHIVVWWSWCSLGHRMFLCYVVQWVLWCVGAVRCWELAVSLGGGASHSR